MFTFLLNKEKSNKEKSENFGPKNYYSRFSLDDVDNSIDVIQLKKWLAEVQLDYENNKVKMQESNDLKYKKHMNFCLFYIKRIKERMAEINLIEASNRRFIQNVNDNDDKLWQSIVQHIIELYPGINLQEIMLKIDETIYKDAF